MGGQHFPGQQPRVQAPKFRQLELPSCSHVSLVETLTNGFYASKESNIQIFKKFSKFVLLWNQKASSQVGIFWQVGTFWLVCQVFNWLIWFDAQRWSSKGSFYVEIWTIPLNFYNKRLDCMKAETKQQGVSAGVGFKEKKGKFVLG